MLNILFLSDENLSASDFLKMLFGQCKKIKVKITIKFLYAAKKDSDIDSVRF